MTTCLGIRRHRGTSGVRNTLVRPIICLRDIHMVDLHLIFTKVDTLVETRAKRMLRLIS